MTSLTPSTFTSMGQDNLGVPYDPQGSIVKGLPDELHEIATLLKTVEGFPTDLHSLSQEQSKVVEDLLASLVSPKVQSLFDQDEDQETADESNHSESGSYWDYLNAPRDMWNSLPSWAQQVVSHGISGNLSIYAHIKLLSALKERRKSKRLAASSTRGTGAGEAATKQSIVNFFFEQGKERVETLLELANNAGQATKKKPSIVDPSIGRSEDEE